MHQLIHDMLYIEYDDMDVDFNSCILQLDKHVIALLNYLANFF